MIISPIAQIILSVGIVSSVIILLVIVLRRGIKSKWLEIPDDKLDTKVTCDHTNCQGLMDVVYRQANIIDLVAKINKLELLEETEQSMSIVEEYLTKLKSLYYSHYLILLRDEYKTKTGIVYDIEGRDYRNILVTGLYEIRDSLRYRIRENGFCDKNDHEWTLYATRAVNHIIDVITEYIDYHYWNGSQIELTSIYDHNQIILPEVKKNLSSLFDALRDKSIEYQDKINVLKDNLNKYLVQPKGVS